MIAFDTDVLTEILLGNATYVTRAAAIPLLEQAVPVIVIEEIMRGRLNITTKKGNFTASGLRNIIVTHNGPATSLLK